MTLLYKDACFAALFSKPGLRKAGKASEKLPVFYRYEYFFALLVRNTDRLNKQIYYAVSFPFVH